MTALYEIALQALQMEKYDEALHYFMDVVGKEPRNTKALYGLGVTHISLGQFHEAAACFQKAIDIDPAWSDPVVMLATCEILVGDSERAIKRLEPFFEPNKRDPFIIFTSAIGYLCSGKNEPGKNSIKELIDISFNVTHHFTHMAKMLLIAKRPKDAHAVLTAVAEYQPESPEIRNLIAECERKMKRFKKPRLVETHRVS